MWFLRKMVSSEVLKLRRNRGQFLTALLLTVGVVIVDFAVAEGLHLYNSTSHGPAGGTSNFHNLITILTFIGSTAAIIIGAYAGSSDESSGVFRDLVASGRSRTSLYLARVAGAILFYLPFLIAALALGIAGTIIFHGNLPNPTAGDFFRNAIVTIAVTIFYLTLSLGFASLTLSRSITVGVLLVWVLFAQRLIAAITFLGSSRKALPLVAQHALNSARGGPFSVPINEGVITAVIVLIVWSAVVLGLGAVRTVRMDA